MLPKKMSIIRYDLEKVLYRMNLPEDTGVVMVNGIIIAFCYKDASFGPREIFDDEYWEDALEYIYGIAMQADLGFPMIRQTSQVPSSEMLAIQLARVRHDLIQISGYIAEYTRLYVMAHAALFPRNRLREDIGITDFDYFVPDYVNSKVTFVVGDDAYTINIRDEVERNTWALVEESVGVTNAWNEKNEECVSWLIEPPYLNDDPSNDVERSEVDDDEFRRRVKGNMMSRMRVAGYGR
jgi:hypothetical protein